MKEERYEYTECIVRSRHIQMDKIITGCVTYYQDRIGFSHYAYFFKTYKIPDRVIKLQAVENYDSKNACKRHHPIVSVKILSRDLTEGTVKSYE